MADHCRTGATDVLDERYCGVFDLVRPGCTGELQIRFHQLIHARRTDRMATRLQPPHGRNGECAIQSNCPILAEMDALSRFGKTPGRESLPS
jgi:hypothetical protein